MKELTTPIILDGALGTELERRGFETTLPLWSAKALIEAPSLVWEIHKDYVDAGADVLTACTFRTTPYTLRKVGLGHRAEELTHQAIRYARAAIAENPSQKTHSKQRTGAEILQAEDGLQDDKHEVFVAGSIAPLEDCYHPELAPSDEVLRKEHARFAKMLKDAEVDLILVETQNSAREAVIATQAAVATGLPVWTALMPGSVTEMFNGDDLAETARRVQQAGPEVILINCARPAIAAGAFGTLTQALPEGGLGIYPNLLGQDWSPSATGLSDPVRPYPTSPDGFADWMKGFTIRAAVLGGCCGTTPEHIRALATQIKRDTHAGVSLPNPKKIG